MYHYVRPHDPGLPFFRHLELDAFREQLDLLGQQHHWVSAGELVEAVKSGRPVEDGVVLTFDDGFTDHFRYVFPELVERNIAGIFYVPTRPLAEGSLLDVHRIHLLLGRNSGQRVFEWLRDFIREEMLSHTHVPEFFTAPYRFHTNDEWAVEVKRTLNYLMDDAVRPQVIEALAKEFLPDEEDFVTDFYLNAEQVREMHEAGMIIGSHTVNHPCMSKLSTMEQAREIRESFAFLERVLGPMQIRTFCYPYGGSHTFTRETEQLLREADCLFSFNVEYRDITAEDLSTRPQSLPRYDCNLVTKLTHTGKQPTTE